MPLKFTTLRAKTVLIVALTTVGILTLLYIPLRLLLLNSFLDLERQTVERNVLRARNAIANRITALNISASDYATWDDTYDYILSRNPSYVEANFIDSTYTNNRLSLVLLLNAAGEVAFAEAYDLEAEEFAEVPPALLTLTAEHPLVRLPQTEGDLAGLLRLPTGPLFIAASPILTSDGQGPPRGVLLMGSAITAQELENLAEITQLDLSLTDLDDPALAPALHTVVLDDPENIHIAPLDQQTIAGRVLLYDIYDAPALLLEIHLPRDIYARGQATLFYLGVALLVAGLVFDVVFQQIIEMIVLTRLAHLNDKVYQIGNQGAQGDFSLRVPVEGTDELAHLGQTINVMLDNLEHYQRELLLQKQRFEDLVAIARATVERPALEDTLQNALQVARRLTRAERGSVFLLDEHGVVIQSILAQDITSPQQQQARISKVMADGLAGWVARERQPALVYDTAQDARWTPLPNATYAMRSALVVPVFSGAENMGILTLTHPEVGHFDADTLALMQGAADQMALAIRNARIYEDQRRLAQQQATLYATLHAIGEHLDPAAVLSAAVETIARLTQWPEVNILRHDPQTDRLTVQATAGDSAVPIGWNIPAAEGVIGRAFRAAATQYVPNVAQEPAYIPYQAHLSSELAVPLQRGGRVLGVLNLESDRPNAFDAEAIALAESLADAITLALEKAESHADIRQYAANLNVMYTLARMLSQSLVLEDTLTRALKSVLELLNFDLGIVSLADPALPAQQIVVARNPAHAAEAEPGATICAYIHAHARSLHLSDVETAPDAPPEIIAPLRAGGMHACIAFPLQHRQHPLGALCLLAHQPRAFAAEDEALHQSIGQQLAIAVTNARLFQAIADERGRLQALIDANSDGILFVGADMNLLVINAAALQMLGLPGKPTTWVNRSLALLLHALRRGAPVAARLALREARRVRDGDTITGQGEVTIQPRHVAWTNLAVQSAGLSLGRLIILHDITQERLLDRMREDLTHTMVHDLRNPLTGIYSALKLLNNGVKETLKTDYQRLLDIAIHNSERMLHLVNAILDISRLESGQMPLERTALEPHALVESVIQSQQPQAADRDVHLLNEMPPDLPALWADQSLIERVLQNLIGNALKFTPAGGRVSVSACRLPDDNPDTPGRIAISVSDTGEGIPPEIRECLFEKFTTGQQAGRGTGLGLTFCKMALEAHGERIWVESTGPAGTTFTFTLPEVQNP